MERWDDETLVSNGNSKSMAIVLARRKLLYEWAAENDMSASSLGRMDVEIHDARNVKIWAIIDLLWGRLEFHYFMGLESVLAEFCYEMFTTKD